MKEDIFFIFGIGYTSKQLIEDIKKDNFFKNVKIVGTTTSLENKRLLQAKSIETFIFNEKENEINEDYLKNAKYILHSIPSKEKDLVTKYIPLLEKNKNLKWFGYLSTTGVYGNYNGKWVNEKTIPKPYNNRTVVRLETENAFLNSSLPANVFRLAGIYGKGRNVLEDLKDGYAKHIYKKGQFFSRIHVEDIALTLIQSIKLATKKQIFNVCDNSPAPSHKVLKYAAKLLNIKLPKAINYKKALEKGALSPMGIEFYSSNKRVKNTKIKKLLKVKLKYKNYKKGLKSIHNL